MKRLDWPGPACNTRAGCVLGSYRTLLQYIPDFIMAKSLRSKRERKLRNIKRERYAVKELKKLKEVLGIVDNQTTSSDVEMAVSDIASVVDAKRIHGPEAEAAEEGVKSLYCVKGGETKFDTDGSSEDEGNESVEPAEMDHSHKRIFNRRTKRDQFGNYPIWFKSKDIKKMRKKDKYRKRLQKIEERKRVKQRPRKKSARKTKQKEVVN